MDRRKLVLFTVDKLGPYHTARFNGVADISDVLVLEFRDRSLIYPWFDSDGSRFEVVNLRYSSPLSWPRIIFTVMQTVFSMRIDLLVLEGWGARLSWIVWCLSLIKGNNICVLSDSKEDDKRRFGAGEVLKKIFIRFCRFGFVGGARHADYLLKLGMGSNQIITGCDVVDNSLFDRGDLRFGEDSMNDAVVFLVCCRLVKRKNVCVILRALYLLLDKSPYLKRRVKLRIVGDGPEKQSLIKLARELSIITSVEFLGEVSYKRIPEIYFSADVLVHMSLVEQWGLVINEALAARLPVIVLGSIGCVPELVTDHWNGRLIERNDPEELSLVMADFVNMKPSERGRMGLRGLKLVENFSLKTYVAAISNMLKQVS